jgi:hypothetical protein
MIIIHLYDIVGTGAPVTIVDRPLTSVVPGLVFNSVVNPGKLAIR